MRLRLHGKNIFFEEKKSLLEPSSIKKFIWLRYPKMSYLYAYQCNANESLQIPEKAGTREPSMGLYSNIITFRNTEHNSAAGLEVVDCCCMKYVFILPTEPSGYALIPYYLPTYIHNYIPTFRKTMRG